MKINEVTTKKQLDEGPIDTIKQIGAGLKGAYQGFKAGGLGNIGAGAKAGYSAAGAAQAQTAKIKLIADKALQKWAAYNQNIKMSTGADATPEQAVQWLAQFMGQPPRTQQPAGSNPAQIQQWLQKEIAGYVAQKEMSGRTVPQAVNPATTTQAPPANQQQQTTQQQTQADQTQQQQQTQPQSDQTQQQQQTQTATTEPGLPDISQLTKEELLQLRQQLQAA